MLDKDGNLFMTKEQLQKCLDSHQGGWSSYAYILHDKDVYDAEACYQHSEKNRKTYLERLMILSDAKGLERDETTESGFVFDEELSRSAQKYADEQFPPVERNSEKPAHWHVILVFNTNRKLDEIAHWFVGLNGKKLESNWNEIKTGRGAAENAWLYLVHARDERKFQYNKDEVIASFNYIDEIEEQIRLDESHEKYHIDDDLFNDVVEEVSHGLPIKEAIARVSMAKYLSRKRIFDEARRWYILNEAPMPLFREVFYVDSEGIDDDHGKGGLGKSACSKALAKQLAREFGADVSKNINDLQDFVFIAGDAKVFLQEYDGQPVVLIDEINGTDFKRACKGVNGVKSLLSPYPERKSLDKKHGAVVCTAKYIIINGIQSFEAFKKALAKGDKIDGVQQDSEDAVKEQFDRRFWGCIHIIDASKLEFWVNRGLFDNTPEQQVLEMIGRVRASFQQIASLTSGNAQAQIEGQVLRPLLDEVSRSQLNHGKNQKIIDPDDLPPELLSMGEIISDDDDDFQEPIAVSARNPYDVVNEMIELDLYSIEDFDDALSYHDLAQIAIDYHFKHISFNHIKDREKRRFIFSALTAISELQKKGG
jgi:hypothetical protein